jgi:TonB family protein
MSPSGGDKSGIGSSGGGTGISRGNGSGSGMAGTATGAAVTGLGHGSDVNAHGGISPSNGPGGAGSAPAGSPAVRGVDISGGSGIVTIGSFGSETGTGSAEPTASRRTKLKQPETLNVWVAGTAGSGGAFEPYKNLLHGEKGTTYVDTTVGTVVMEYADYSAADHTFRGALSPPKTLRADLPADIPHARMVLTCTLDTSGNIKNIRVLESGPAAMTAKVLSALRSWKFQPAMRNDQPVDVTAILGFGVNTDDRF